MLLLALCVPRLLQTKCLVEHNAARPGEAAHLAVLFPVGFQPVAVCLTSQHAFPLGQEPWKRKLTTAGAADAILPRPERRDLSCIGSVPLAGNNPSDCADNKRSCQNEQVEVNGCRQ